MDILKTSYQAIIHFIAINNIATLQLCTHEDCDDCSYRMGLPFSGNTATISVVWKCYNQVLEIPVITSI